MTADEVFASREEVGRRIIANIQDYGTPDGKKEFAERPYNDLSSMKYPFTGANYLRVLASGEQDPRWYKLTDTKRFGFRVRPGAETIELESWKHLEKGIQQATGKLEKYVNARYVMDLPPKEPFLLDHGENMDKAVRLLRFAENPAKQQDFVYPKGKEDLFYRLANASRSLMAEEVGEEEARKSLVPPLAAYLAFKTVGLSMDYEKNPLFSEGQLEQLEGERGARNLFHAMGKASSILSRLRTAELTLFDGYAHEGQGEYFKDLRVTLFYSEATELTGKGVHNEHQLREESAVRQRNFYAPGVYKQEAAYELLTAMLRVDKERWEGNLGRHDSFGRTKISVENGNFQLNEAVINLGRLEFGNQPTAIRGLGRRLPMEAKKELEDEEGMRLHLFRYDRTLEENSEAVQTRQKELQKYLVECEATRLSLYAEERKYLRGHEDLQEEMGRYAPTYLYFYDGMESLTEEHVKNNLMEIHQSTMPFQNARVDSPEGKSIGELSEDGIIVESRWPLRTEKGRPVYTEKELEDYRNLDRFSIAYREEGQPFTAEMPIVRGDRAMEKFIGHKLEDAALSMIENHPQSYEVGVKMEFRYDDKPFYSIRYTEGSGELNRRLPVGMPHLEDPQEDRKFQEAVHTWAKFHNENRLDACTLLYSKSWVPVIERREKKKLALAKTKGQTNDNVQKVAEQKAAGMGR